MDPVLQLIAAGRKAVVVDIAFRSAHAAVITVRVPRKVHRILAQLALPFGIARARSHVLAQLGCPGTIVIHAALRRIDGGGRALVLGPIARGLFPTRLATGAVHVTRSRPAAHAHRVGDDVCARHVRVIGENDLAGRVGGKGKRADGAPRVAVHLLVHAHLGCAARVRDKELRVRRARQRPRRDVPDANDIDAGNCRRERPGRRGRRARHHGVGIVTSPRIAGRGAVAPNTSRGITGLIGSDDHLLRAHVVLARRPHVGTGVPQVLDEVLIDHLGVVHIFDDLITALSIALSLPAFRVVPIPPVPGAQINRLACQRAGRISSVECRRSSDSGFRLAS